MRLRLRSRKGERDLALASKLPRRSIGERVRRGEMERWGEREWLERGVRLRLRPRERDRAGEGVREVMPNRSIARWKISPTEWLMVPCARLVKEYVNVDVFKFCWF